MSQMAPEAPPRRRDNAFTRKIGPLPMWAWLAIVATAIVIWGVYSARKNAQAQQQQSTTNASQVPDFILQDYQQTGPPGPPGPPGSSGGGGGQINGGGGIQPITPAPGAVTPITNPGGNVRSTTGGGSSGFTPVNGGQVTGTGPEKATPVRKRGTVRTTPKAPHPARKPAPRHTAPRHPARG